MLLLLFSPQSDAAVMFNEPNDFEVIFIQPWLPEVKSSRLCDSEVADHDIMLSNLTSHVRTPGNI
jgi:hypothetical protein